MHEPPAPRRPPILALTLGWLLLVYFALRAASLGDMAADVRAFQFAYVTGFAGYGVLVWILVRVAVGDTCPSPISNESGSATIPNGSSAKPACPALGDDRARRLGGWRWWVLGCVVLRAAVVFMQPSDDVYRYVWEGRVQRAGFNPYAHAPDDPRLASLRNDDWKKINHRDYPAIYGPIAQWQFRLVAAVHATPRVMKLVQVVWDILGVLMLGACLKRVGRPPHLAMLYGLCPLVLTSFAIEGHLDASMLLLLVVMTWAILTNRPGLAGAFLGLAVATKIVAVVLWPWFLIRHPKAAGVAVLVTAVCYLPFADAGSGLIESLLRFGSDTELFSFLAAFNVTSFQTRASCAVVGASVAAALFLLAWRRADFTRCAIGSTTVLLLLTPIVHYWYLTWVLLWTPFSVRLGWIAAALTMVVYLEAGFHEQTTGTWVMPTWAPTLVWSSFLAGCLVEWGFRWRQRRSALECVDA